jgi:hypothetical protein
MRRSARNYGNSRVSPIRRLIFRMRRKGSICRRFTSGVFTVPVSIQVDADVLVMKKEYDSGKGKRGPVMKVPQDKIRVTIRLDKDIPDRRAG